MHSLLPDKVEVFDAQQDKVIAVKDLSEIIFERGTAVNTSVPLQNLLFSLGVGHAGDTHVHSHYCSSAEGPQLAFGMHAQSCHHCLFCECACSQGLLQSRMCTACRLHSRVMQLWQTISVYPETCTVKWQALTSPSPTDTASLHGTQKLRGPDCLQVLWSFATTRQPCATW